MPYVNCPPGMRGLHMEDGTRYRADREGGRMLVDDRHVAAIDRMGGNGTAGLVTARFREFGGSKTPGRWCVACQPARLWNAWNLTCPRPGCGAETVPEGA